MFTRICLKIIPYYILIIIIFLIITTTANLHASTLHDCRSAEYNFTLTKPYGGSVTLSNTVSPRRVVISLGFAFSPGTTLTTTSPATPIISVSFPLASSTATTANLNLAPTSFSNSSSSSNVFNVTFNAEKATLNISNIIIVVRSYDGSEKDIIESALATATLKIGNLCGRILEFGHSSSFEFIKAAIATKTNQQMSYEEARDDCRSEGYRLPNFLKSTDYSEFKSEWGSSFRAYHIGSQQYDWRPNYAIFCWNDDFDFDPALCSNLTASEEYFAFYRSDATNQLDCKSSAIDCNAAFHTLTDKPGWDELGVGTGLNFSIRMAGAQDWKWQDTRSPRDFYKSCMELITYKSFSDGIVQVQNYETITKTISISDPSRSLASVTESKSDASKTKSDPSKTKSGPSSSVSFSLPSPTLSAEFDDSLSSSDSSSPSKSSTSSKSFKTRSISRSLESQSMSDPSYSDPTSTFSHFPTKSKSKSRKTHSQSEPSSTPSEEFNPNSTSHSFSNPSPSTSNPSTSVSLSNPHDPSATRTHIYHTPSISLTRDSKTPTFYKTPTIAIPPPPFPLANAIPADEAAAVAATTTLAATMAAPAAAQTLRSMSILGTVGTEERCKLVSIGKDTYASTPPSFPESFFPPLTLPTGGNGNQTQEEIFALPARRGAILANCILAPVCIALGALVVGLVRKRVHKKSYGDVTALSAGRVPGITCSLIGALFADGVFGNATILFFQKDVAVGDVVLGIFGIGVILAIVITPGAILYREIRREESEGRPIECVSSFIRRKPRKKKKIVMNDDETENGGETMIDLSSLIMANEETEEQREKNTSEITSSASHSKKTKPMGFLWFLFGDETWKGNVEIVERYRSIFASNRGLNSQTSATFSTYKINRRRLATWSFYVEVSMTILAAIGRGFATAAPCDANNRVQFMQLAIAAFAFCFSLNVLAPISPMRRLAAVCADLVMFLGTLTLVALGSESAKMVGRCALAAAFMSTASSLALFIMRRIILPLRGIEIVGASKVKVADGAKSCPNRESGGNHPEEEDGAVGGRVGQALGNLLVFPFLSMSGGGADGEVDDDENNLLIRNAQNNYQQREQDDDDDELMQITLETDDDEELDGFVNINLGEHDDDQEVDLSDFLRQEEQQEENKIVENFSKSSTNPTHSTRSVDSSQHHEDVWATLEN